MISEQKGNNEHINVVVSGATEKAKWKTARELGVNKIAHFFGQYYLDTFSFTAK